jgi:hypothetical protein
MKSAGNIIFESKTDSESLFLLPIQWNLL